MRGTPSPSNNTLNASHPLSFGLLDGVECGTAQHFRATKSQQGFLATWRSFSSPTISFINQVNQFLHRATYPLASHLSDSASCYISISFALTGLCIAISDRFSRLLAHGAQSCSWELRRTVRYDVLRHMLSHFNLFSFGDKVFHLDVNGNKAQCVM